MWEQTEVSRNNQLATGVDLATGTSTNATCSCGVVKVFESCGDDVNNEERTG